MGMYIARYEADPDGPKGILLHIRIRGQRWYHLCCFGRVRHYRKDGSCAHTDALVDELTDYGKRVTKLQPWGDYRCAPKRVREQREVAA